MKSKIILDTDIGDDIDDAFALMIAVNSQNIDLLGVTTVFRNTEKRGKIVKAILHEMHEDILVYAGINDALNQDVKEILSNEVKLQETFDEKGIYIPPQYTKQMDHFQIDGYDAIKFMHQTITKFPNEVTIVGIGPLTNIATFINQYPQTAQLVKEVVIMGGWFSSDEFREWNILCDPEAANILFKSGIKIKMLGLDVTLQCTLNKNDLTQIKKSKNNTISLINTMLDAWFIHFKDETPIMYDPLAITTIFAETVSFKRTNVEVLLKKDRAKTIEVASDKNNHYIGIDVKIDYFKEIFFKLFKKEEMKKNE